MRYRALGLMVLLMSVYTEALAQGTAGSSSVSGIVRDQTGAVLSGVQVILRPSGAPAAYSQ